MQYYTFDLDEQSKEYCVIAMPFGLYRYLNMPMGISPSSDISQDAMQMTLSDVEEADAYLDNVKCWSESLVSTPRDTRTHPLKVGRSWILDQSAEVRMGCARDGLVRILGNSKTTA